MHPGAKCFQNYSLAIKKLLSGILECHTFFLALMLYCADGSMHCAVCMYTNGSYILTTSL